MFRSVYHKFHLKIYKLTSFFFSVQAMTLNCIEVNRNKLSPVYSLVLISHDIDVQNKSEGLCIALGEFHSLYFHRYYS